MKSISASSNFDSLFESAERLEQSGQVIQAELLYSRILAECPDNGLVASHLARLSRNRGDTARAIRLLESAVRSCPGQP